MADYFLDRDHKNIEKLRQISAELPSFCSDYFVGVESRTTPLTRINYAHDYKIFFDYLSRFVLKKEVSEISLQDLNRVTASQIEQFLSYLSYYKDKDGNEHTNTERGKTRFLSSIRSLFKYFFNKDKLDANVASKVEPPKMHAKEIIRLEPNEVALLLDETENGDRLSGRQISFHSKTGVRDTAIVTLFLGTGIRISELVGLNVEDIDFEENSFRITRKGGSRVILYFNEEVSDALKRWIELREENPITSHENALFLSLQNKRIGVRAVENLVKKYARTVTPLKNISPHKLRSTFGTNLYRETQDIYMVADVLGHKDVNTTKKHYAAIGEDMRRTAARKVVLRNDSEK